MLAAVYTEFSGAIKVTKVNRPAVPEDGALIEVRELVYLRVCVLCVTNAPF